jgi:streptogramin lyase
MNRKLCLSGLVGALGLAMLFFGVTSSSGQNKGMKSPGAAATGTIAGTGSLSGTVKASKEFKAAQVYARNVEKNVVYMVFTENGKYDAVDLFPGAYEVSVEKEGFTGGDVQKVNITAGANATADFTLTEGNGKMPYSGPRNNFPLMSYDEIYPAGHVRELLEKTCIRCHGYNFLPSKQWDESQWNDALALMQNPFDNAGQRLVPGTFTPEERTALVAYLVNNFGPTAKKRELLVPEHAIDEKALGKAMIMEYHLPDLADKKPRGTHDLHLSKDGEVWYADARGLQVGKMDPRTATFTDYALKGAEVRGHGITQDPVSGDIIMAGHTEFVKVDSKTGEIKYIPYDPNAPRPPHGNTPMVDSKGNVWETLSWANELAKLDKTTGEVSLYKAPTDNSFPYGMVVDKSDKVWYADWWRCKATKYDPSNGQWIEYTPLTQPCTMRRVFSDHNGMVWYALYYPGKLGLLNPSTNKIVAEYDMPTKYSIPYDIQEDHENNLWVADAGQGGGVVKFVPQTKAFTYYPFQQRTDSPKIEVSRQNSVWYTTRSAPSQTTALGVIYPDKSKITSFSAAY